MTAVNEFRELNPFSAIQTAHTLWCVYLMTRNRHKIDIHFFYIDLHIADSLNCIGMKENTTLSTKLSYFSYRLNSADLIVCSHYAYKVCVGLYSFTDGVSGNKSLRIHGNDSNLKPFLFQSPAAVEDSTVFYRRCNYMLLSKLFSQQGTASDRKIVGFCSSACEQDLMHICSDRLSCFFSGKE